MSMSPYVFVQVKQTKSGPVVQQHGRIVEALGTDHAVINFFTPASHTRVMHVSDLRNFVFFTTQEELQTFLVAISPPKPEPAPAPAAAPAKSARRAKLTPVPTPPATKMDRDVSDLVPLN
jgi:hypothetical protein